MPSTNDPRHSDDAGSASGAVDSSWQVCQLCPALFGITINRALPLAFQ
ncbi:hypothetical protein SynMVIR181_01226 [Synechococcus sp. MVIR-18-1]|nr:hypothetical protein SynMVIR181_01226 [Synechococcus sp. MVIR-18-1]